MQINTGGKGPHEWSNEIGNPEYASDLESLRSKVPSLEEMVPEVGKKGDEMQGGN